ncbi:MAG: teichoic acid transporter, partial [Clostridiales bacterium]|nr:teichoic acid transporter [Clostridiales bacterium]
MTRTQSTLRNAKLSVACQIITLLTSFVARAFVARFLISEYYLSLSGLFSNVLTVISLAELGVGAAVSFSLYKPLSENDETKVRALMRFFRRAYTIIGIAVFSLGIALTPVLNFLINDFDDVKSAIPEFYLIYVLYVANSAVSYFFSYKKTLIIADQKKYLFSFIAAASSILLCASRCVAIAFFQNYVLYMALAVAFTVAENVVISGCANKLYPYLKNKEKCKLSGEDLSVIKTNMGASVMHSIGGVAVNGTDNILISKIVGFISEGIYTNYHMITAALDGIIGITLESSTPSFGNLCASDDSEHKITVFNRMFFASSWLYGFSAICFYILVNPFISLWIGKEMFLSP